MVAYMETSIIQMASDIANGFMDFLGKSVVSRLGTTAGGY